MRFLRLVEQYEGFVEEIRRTINADGLVEEFSGRVTRISDEVDHYWSDINFERVPKAERDRIEIGRFFYASVTMDADGVRELSICFPLIYWTQAELDEAARRAEELCALLVAP